jgi:hypothetical protein
MQLPANATRGTQTRADSIVAFASAVDYQGFNGLGLRCVIEQQMLTAAEIDHALRSLRTRVT